MICPFNGLENAYVNNYICRQSTMSQTGIFPSCQVMQVFMIHFTKNHGKRMWYHHSSRQNIFQPHIPDCIRHPCQLWPSACMPHRGVCESIVVRPSLCMIPTPRFRRQTWWVPLRMAHYGVRWFSPWGDVKHEHENAHMRVCDAC